MTRTKVCGFTNGPDLRHAVGAGVDAVGAIAEVTVDTPREVTPERAADLLAAVPPFVTTVVVTMPTAPARALELVSQVRPDAVQLHGDLSPADVAHVAANTGASVVRAVAADEPDRARRHDAVADALLLDTPDTEGGGGTGRTHDWTSARDLAAELDSPVVLAGGLAPDNVAAAVRTVEPFAVDVASGVEREPGRKDHDAVAAFVENARRPGAEA
ncbi:MAG: phosphoribosylanthranilate isomerase [Halobacteriales archaeon]